MQNDHRQQIDCALSCLNIALTMLQTLGYELKTNLEFKKVEKSIKEDDPPVE